MSNAASEGLYGPPSETISLHELLALGNPYVPAHHTLDETWNSLSDDEKKQLDLECSVQDVKNNLTETLENPFLYAYIAQNLEDNIDLIRASAKPGGRVRKAYKRRRLETNIESEPINYPQEVLQLRSSLDGVRLKCWTYTVDAAAFMRSPKNSDTNVLTDPRKAKTNSAVHSDSLVLLISVFNRLSWGNQISRTSQHAVLSSQTVGNLYDVLPCSANDIANNDRDPGETVNGYVVCIEGVAYGDGKSEEDYSEKLMKQISLLPEKKRPRLTKGPNMYEQTFSDLSLRINNPYWLLHQGNCEHFFIVDQIRFLHPSDPRDGYPLTLHLSPLLVDLCHACSKVPATLSVVGDVRLGQSPCKLCGPCWRYMGPSGDAEVAVIELSNPQTGWAPRK